MESEKSNDGELTSTMGNILSTSREEKNDASDSTPTSSTDAFTTTSRPQIAADDPISSTSSEVCDSRKSTEKVTDVAQSSTSNVMSSLKDISADNKSPIVSEKDLLDMNITDTSTEKITENVDDLVQDLENLLGEPTTSFNFTIRPRDVKRTVTSDSQRDVPMDLDAFSLEMFGEKSVGLKETTEAISATSGETIEVQNNAAGTESSGSIKTSNVENVLTNSTDSVVDCIELESASVCAEKDLETIETAESSKSELKTDTTEEATTEVEQNCQSEIVSDSTPNVPVEKEDIREVSDITSTHTKSEDSKDSPTVVLVENEQKVDATLSETATDSNLDEEKKTESQMSLDNQVTTEEPTQAKALNDTLADQEQEVLIHHEQTLADQGQEILKCPEQTESISSSVLTESAPDEGGKGDETSENVVEKIEETVDVEEEKSHALCEQAAEEVEKNETVVAMDVDQQNISAVPNEADIANNIREEETSDERSVTRKIEKPEENENMDITPDGPEVATPEKSTEVQHVAEEQEAITESPAEVVNQKMFVDEETDDTSIERNQHVEVISEEKSDEVVVSIEGNQHVESVSEEKTDDTAISVEGNQHIEGVSEEKTETAVSAESNQHLEAVSEEKSDDTAISIEANQHIEPVSEEKTEAAVSAESYQQLEAVSEKKSDECAIESVEEKQEQVEEMTTKNIIKNAEEEETQTLVEAAHEEIQEKNQDKPVVDNSHAGEIHMEETAESMDDTEHIELQEKKLEFASAEAHESEQKMEAEANTAESVTVEMQEERQKEKEEVTETEEIQEPAKGELATTEVVNTETHEADEGKQKEDTSTEVAVEEERHEENSEIMLSTDVINDVRKEQQEDSLKIVSTEMQEEKAETCTTTDVTNDVQNEQQEDKVEIVSTEMQEENAETVLSTDVTNDVQNEQQEDKVELVSTEMQEDKAETCTTMLSTDVTNDVQNEQQQDKVEVVSAEMQEENAETMLSTDITNDVQNEQLEDKVEVVSTEVQEEIEETCTFETEVPVEKEQMQDVTIPEIVNLAACATQEYQKDEQLEKVLVSLNDEVVEEKKEQMEVSDSVVNQDESTPGVVNDLLEAEGLGQTQLVSSSTLDDTEKQELVSSCLIEQQVPIEAPQVAEVSSGEQLMQEPAVDESECKIPENMNEIEQSGAFELPESKQESTEFPSIELVEQVKPSEEDLCAQINIPVEICSHEDSFVDSNVEMPLDVPPVDFIPDSLELPTRSLEDDLDLLVQNTVNESITASAAVVTLVSQEEKSNSMELELPTSSVDNAAIENVMLPLAVEDVQDLDVLNAISSLEEKTNLTPDLVQETDALLTSSTVEQATFEPSIDSVLPTVDEIFAEPNQQPQVELQDDNLETLLAVASLQNVDYNMPTVEDFTPSMEQIPGFPSEEAQPPKVQDEKIESLFEEKEEETVEKSDEVEPVVQQTEDKLKEPLVINIDDSEKERVYSPRITIKPIKPSEEEEEAVTSASGESECSKGSLKMTITKQSDNTHSILKIYDPDDSGHDEHNEPHQVPKLIIKPIVQPNEPPQSPKMSTRNSKQVFSPSHSTNQRSASPRITIKPIPKPEEAVAPLKITIKPLKAEETHRQKHSPKLTIKPIHKPEDDCNVEPKVHSPRVTIKPIVKPVDEIDQVPSPRITIKPIVKPDNVPEAASSTPRVTIKPVVKPQEKEKNVEIEQMEKSSPKITIKPIVKPQEVEPPPEDYEESIKERIVLKINKGTIPPNTKELRKREIVLDEEKSEKLAKIKVKISKGGGHPQIVQEQSPSKRSAEHSDHDRNKRQKVETEQILPGVTLTPIPPATHSKLKEMLSRNHFANDNKVVTIDDDDDDVTIVEETNKSSPIVISEESNQDSMNAAIDLRDPISEIPVFEITPDSVKTINPQPAPPVVEVPAPLPAPRKRGRPRKVPLQVREDFKDPKEEEPKPVVIESTRPKRSCRGQSVRTTLGIKPRKPRGPGRGRGSKRGMGTRSTPTPPETPPKAAKEPKLSGAKLNELKEDTFLLSDKTEVKQIEIDDGLQKSPSNSLLAPPQSDTSTTDRADIVMYEEETRMSAETSSRAQTPAKQVVTTITTVDLVEESQSSLQSIQSTATTESVKVRRGPRLEVHQEPEGAVISAEQLAEYYWGGGGPFMLQEQVAQFLGIKSFKRKYPNIARRVVDMQERDFIRESGLAGEAMCDLGLTAVNSSDILDIMYSDFQDKYEEYCKHQRDRQAKDLTNKQKALSLAASQEKTKMDITQQAVQSAASWNATFNKTRREQRKACMDLQTLTVHFPRGKMKQINKPKIGYYPVALVPGQFTDYYREFTPTELNNLPLNTVCYDRIIRGSNEMECDSQTDGSGSESDSSSSDSDSSYSGSSDGEDCTICKPAPKRIVAAAQ